MPQTADLAEALRRFGPSVPTQNDRTTQPSQPGTTAPFDPANSSIVGTPSFRTRIGEETLEEGALADTRRGERDETRTESLGAVRGFDPFGFAKTTSRALFSDLDQALGRSENQRRVSGNARGFFGSPIGRADLMRDFNDKLSRGLARFGLDAAQLEGQNIDRLIGIGRDDRAEAFDTRTRELDLTASNADREQGAENFRLELQERERARKQAEKDRGGGIFGFIKDVASFVPGVGTAVDVVGDLIDRF